MSSTQTFEDAILAAGYAPPQGGCIMDGKLRRFPSDSARPHSKDAWYVGFDDSKGRAGSFGSWRDSNTLTWSNGTGRKLTTEEISSIKAQQEAYKEKAKSEANAAAQRAQRIFATATETGKSDYLAKKKIKKPDGVKFVKNLDATALGFEKSWNINGILVPMRNLKGDIRSLQIIADGADKKLFMPSGQTVGLFHILGGTLEGAKRIIIAEGIATAQSCHEATGCVSVCAFSAGNLERTARAVRSLNATADIIIAADGDEAGRKYSKIAASACNGKVIEAPDGKDFNDVPMVLPQNDDSLWRADLIVSNLKDGTQKTPCRVHNLILILRHAPEFAGKLRFNEFSMTVEMNGKPITDSLVSIIKSQFEKGWITERVSTGDLWEAFHGVSVYSSYHSVREYLASLKWDGTSRINEFFSDQLGTPNDEYHQAASRCLFISAVARVHKPGCKVDTMTILEGVQGVGKSTFWKALSDPWYADITDNITRNDFLIGLLGIWFADLGELDQFGKAESSRVKQVITIESDHVRLPYGRAHQTVARQNIFVGGTNRSDWANDPTGGRRFIPIKCNQAIDIPAVKAMRDQLWAEAVARYRSGEDWWVIPDAYDHQEERYNEDPWQEPIRQWLEFKTETTSSEILLQCLKIPLGLQNRAEQTRVGNVMIRLPWEKKRGSDKGKRVWKYFLKKQ